MGSDDSGLEAERGPTGSWLGNLSRRAFLRRGGLTAAAIGVVGAIPGAAGLLAGASSDAPSVADGATETETEAASLSEPLVAHVTDLSTGKISLFRGEEEIVVRDPALARRLLAATVQGAARR